MTERPITPTRIIPADGTLPTAPPLPPHPPGPGDIPPWREPPPPVAPPPPPPAAIEVHHVHTHILIPAEPEPEPEPEPPRFDWARLVAWLRPRQTLLGLAAAVIPMPHTGYSLAAAWSVALADARTDSISGAYVLAGTAVTLTALIDRRRSAWWSRTLLAATLIGGTGALGWFDLITLLTGVRP